MASNPSPELNAIMIPTPDLMLALSNEPLAMGVAGMLLSKGFLSGEIVSKMLDISLTSTEKTTILIEALRNEIELAPSKFMELLDILSEVECAKEVVEILNSAYQSKLHSRLGHTKKIFCCSSYRNFINLHGGQLILIAVRAHGQMLSISEPCTHLHAGY